MHSTVLFVLDGRLVRLEFPPGGFPCPTTTLLQYLRTLPGHRGTKEGCAEGDCGACTVVFAEPDGANGLRYRAVDSCLVFLPMLHGKQVITVENLRDTSGALHPVQQALVDHFGSQCGFCTPGVVMSLFALYKSAGSPSRDEVVDAVAGNLCRCTGYRSIVDAGCEACSGNKEDRFDAETPATLELLSSIPRGTLRLDTGSQRYARPASLAEALEMRRSDPDALVICGATDIALRVTKKHEEIPSILDLADLPELSAIEIRGDGVFYGAAVTMQDILESSAGRFPPLAEMLSVFGSRQIRNMATIGGNVGTASPVGDTLPVLMALHAEIELTGAGGVRRVPVERMLAGYRKTVCRPDELISRIFIPALPSGAAVKSYKISRRRDMDISTVSAGFRLERDAHGDVGDILLAFGGMAEVTRRAGRTEEFLRGKPWTRATAEQAGEIAAHEFSPLSDVRGGAAFRMTIARNLLLKFWEDVRS